MKKHVHEVYQKLDAADSELIDISGMVSLLRLIAQNLPADGYSTEVWACADTIQIRADRIHSLLEQAITLNAEQAETKDLIL